jgi:endonuclease YncB( thermonuclease family)
MKSKSFFLILIFILILSLSYINCKLFKTIGELPVLTYEYFFDQDKTDDKIYINSDNIRVVDGDTIKVNEQKIRFLGVDTPEMRQEPYGEIAKQFTLNAIRSAGEIYYLNTKKYDQYARLLTYIFVDEECLSLLLIKNKLGYETISKYGEGNYPDIAAQIKDAFYSQQLPPFENPATWRNRN